MLNHAHILRTAVTAAREAGREMTRAHRNKMTVTAKSGPLDLVTSYDVDIESRIIGIIREAFPDSSFCAEETGVDPASEIHWYIDPIDGTNNFVRGIPLSCVSIAATVDGVPLVGCVYDPWRDEMFASDTIGALSRRTGSGADNRLLLTDLPHPGERVESWHLDVLGLLLTHFELRRIGSTALALAYVAAGRAALALNVGVRPWDVAAGSILVRAAGGGYADRRPWNGDADSIGYLAHAPGCEQKGDALAAALEPYLTAGASWPAETRVRS